MCDPILLNDTSNGKNINLLPQLNLNDFNKFNIEYTCDKCGSGQFPSLIGLHYTDITYAIDCKTQTYKIMEKTIDRIDNSATIYGLDCHTISRSGCGPSKEFRIDSGPSEQFKIQV